MINNSRLMSMHSQQRQHNFSDRWQSLPGRQAGLSLIELMIASAIGLVILAGAVTIFSGNSSSAAMSAGMARVQDNGRVALDILTNGVRMAGYEGCRSQIKEAPVVMASTRPTIDLPLSAFWGAEYTDAQAWEPEEHADLAGIVDRPRPGTDVLYLQHGSGNATNLNNDMPDAAAGTITLARNPNRIATGDLMMIADCEGAHIFRATNVAPNNGLPVVTFGVAGNTQGNFGVQYLGAGAMDTTPLRVMRFESNAYFVADSFRETAANTPIFSLFGLDTAADPIGEPTELIEGVENLQIQYGERVGTNIRYVPADEVINRANVVSIQIGMLISTADFAGQLPDTNIYNIAGVTVGPPGANTDENHPGDRRLRAAFNTTIQLRNRQFQL